MRILLPVFIACLMLNCADTMAADSHWEEMQRIKQYHENTKNSTRGAVSPEVKKPQITSEKQIKQPSKPVVQPSKPVVNQPSKPVVNQPSKPVVQPSKPVVQPSKPVVKNPERTKHDNKPGKDINPHKSHHNEPHKPIDKPHHHKPVVQQHNTYIYTTSTVPYITSGRGVIYQTNPHIYTANAYNCYFKDELKYCADNAGRALTGRIVQNYTDSVAYENYRNGYLNGETSVYTLDGTLLQTTNYSKGLKHGKETVYYDNGRVNYTVNYSRGVLSGRVVQYDYNGVLLGEMQYSNGRYTSRYCRNGTSNDLLRARIKENVRNELILCDGN